MSCSTISVSSSVYFDCVEGDDDPIMDHSQSFVKWNSEIKFTLDQETLSSSEIEQNVEVTSGTASDTSLLIIIFYDDIFQNVSFYFTETF